MEITTALLICYITLWVIMELHQYWIRKDLLDMEKNNYDLHSDTRKMIKSAKTELSLQLAAMSKKIEHLEQQNNDLKKDNAELMRQLNIVVEKLRDIETGNTKVMTV